MYSCTKDIYDLQEEILVVTFTLLQLIKNKKDAVACVFGTGSYWFKVKKVQEFIKKGLLPVLAHPFL
jgi:hypothetical protein